MAPISDSANDIWAATRTKRIERKGDSVSTDSILERFGGRTTDDDRENINPRKVAEAVVCRERAVAPDHSPTEPILFMRVVGGSGDGHRWHWLADESYGYRQHLLHRSLAQIEFDIGLSPPHPPCEECERLARQRDAIARVRQMIGPGSDAAG